MPRGGQKMTVHCPPVPLVTEEFDFEREKKTESFLFYCNNSNTFAYQM